MTDDLATRDPEPRGRPAPPAGVPHAVSRRDNAVIWVLIVAAFVVILNETVMSVAIPHLMEDLAISAVDAQWLTTAFLLTMSIVIPVTGFLLRRFHTRPVFLTAMSLFVSGTLIAALAPGYEVLLIARVVQASGTAIMLPLLITTVMQLEPPETRGRRMGSISVVIAVAPAIGPTMSGLILSVLPWRFMFVFVLPIAGAVLALGWRLVRNVTEPTDVPIDILSVVLSALGFGGIVFGLSRIGEAGGGSVPASAFASLGVGAVALALFVWRQLVLQRIDDALLDLRTFRVPTFAVSIVMFVILMMSLFGMIILLPLFMQNVLGLTVLQSGLLLLPGGLLMGLCAPGIGRAVDRIGPRPLLIPGAALVAGVLWSFAFVLSESTPWWVLLACHVTMSAGLALMFTPLFAASLGSLPPHLYAYGSATVSTVQQVAGAAGTALFVSTMAAVAASQESAGVDAVIAEATGIRAAYLVAAILATGAVAASFFIQRPADSPGPGHAAH
ncbi:DHA2 family efflux MFS transporter permease subunit [Demequina mangrovi]|uniref:MFS transporter, DHA2 family, lincomycin resistance protein n=1 Tax=Demequina mangrovi TaxID=1043493 RepID=A0A1H6V0M4_9MICO|nr:DHA2 family efflux MFS transporter permease subunit [Demequina mangrovi]SEI98133.1 MFS transporter, DHA2 family, lincomycin resistance protein [Demequina mangrovi]